MSRLIVVSNRVSPPSEEGASNQGGLAVALSSALRQTGGIWFGWSGNETEEFTGHINFEKSAGVTSATIDLEASEIEEYYNGYANRTLWPLFHYRIDLAEFDRTFEDTYARVNQRFAQTLMPLLQPDDVIWVNDYHLIPLGEELRKLGCRNKIGFFLHTPWPPTRLLMALPHHRELVESLFSYDIVGFQTEEWMESFVYYTREQMTAEVSDDGHIVAGDLKTRVMANPIGIDGQEFAEMAVAPDARRAREKIEASLDGRAMLIGVDRLDYSKGLEERFLGYERLLLSRPEMQENVFLLQIAPPSREDVGSYQEIRSTLESLSGRINGAFSSADWVPIRYVNRGYPRTELAGIYRAARVGLVTPLRDGMNLVAKEFVASQDPEDPGVLVLSSFAGAASQMTEAILVNPYSAEELADGIAQALAMPKEERVRRWKALMEGVTGDGVVPWLERFVAALKAA